VPLTPGATAARWFGRGALASELWKSFNAALFPQRSSVLEGMWLRGGAAARLAASGRAGRLPADVAARIRATAGGDAA
jgi:hypothetical protein